MSGQDTGGEKVGEKVGNSVGERFALEKDEK